MDKIQDRILTIMSIKNVTNAEFAQAIGVQPSNISHILSGRNKPSLDLIMKIVDRYPEVRLEWLLQGQGSMNKEFGMDLFSDQRQANGRIEKEIASTESKIHGQDRDNDQINPSFEVENDPSPMKSTSNQGDRMGSEKSESDDRKDELPGQHYKSQGDVEKIVIFYRDRTFTEYFPGQE